LPRLEKVAEQYKNQPDVLFLSLNLDDDPGLVDPFLKQHKLSFPVLPAYTYATDTLKGSLFLRTGLSDLTERSASRVQVTTLRQSGNKA